MLISYYLFLLIGVTLIILLLRSYIIRKRDIPVKLFLEALKNENSGHFEAAVVTYENALNKVKKNGFDNYLKNRIIEKLKVLHTIIEYKNGVHFRQIK